MSADRRIARVWCLANGMVFVHDQHGNRMPEYEGKVDVIGKVIERDAPEDTEWYGWPGKKPPQVTGPTFELVDGGRAIKCLQCLKTSWHATDVERRFCSRCKIYHDEAITS